MSLDDRINEYLGSLYEAVYESELWDGAIHEMLQLTNAKASLISSVDVQDREFSYNRFYGLSDNALDRGEREYGEEMFQLDPSLIWASQNPNAGTCDTADLIPKNEYLSHPFVKWAKSRLGSTHWVVAYTPPNDDKSFAVALGPATEVGPLPAEERKLFHLIYGHMKRAVKLASRPPDLSSETEALMILGPSGQMVAASPRAERMLALHDGLSMINGSLVATTSEATMRLGVLLKAASDGSPGGSLALPRRSGRPSWLLLAGPAPARWGSAPIPTRSLLIRIVEPDRAARLLPQHGSIFSLTPRELAVADALMGGHSLESLASELSISRNTARVHLQSLFRKTGTNRQSDLVRTLASIARY